MHQNTFGVFRQLRDHPGFKKKKQRIAQKDGKKKIKMKK